MSFSREVSELAFFGQRQGQDWVELEDLFKVIQCSVLSSALFTVLDILDLVLVL